MKGFDEVRSLISDRAMSVREISERTGLCHSTVRGILSVLRESGKLSVVRKYRVGLNGRFYPTYAYRLMAGSGQCSGSET